MKKTPSALKWLAEKRARIAFDLATKKQIFQDLGRQIADLQMDLASVDRTITIYDSCIDPTGIEPVNGWQGSYGKRGALKEAVRGFIQAAAPNSISSRDLETMVCLKFGIAFATPEQRDQWHEGGFRSALRTLKRDGLIERDGDPILLPGEEGHWRWKPIDHSFESLERKIATKEGSSSEPPAP